MRLLRYDCIESPFSWEIMTSQDLQAIEQLLVRPNTPVEEDDYTIPPTSRMHGVA